MALRTFIEETSLGKTIKTIGVGGQRKFGHVQDFVES